eukprot:bmy_21455T0
MSQKVVKEGPRLSKNQKFSEHFSIHCCPPFTFLNSKREIVDRNTLRADGKGCRSEGEIGNKGEGMEIVDRVREARLLHMRLKGGIADALLYRATMILTIEKEDQTDPSEEVMEEFQVNGRPQLPDSLLLDPRALGQFIWL